MVTLTSIATHFRRRRRTDGGTAGFRDEIGLVMMLPDVAQRSPSRAGGIVKQNLNIQKVFSTRRVTVRYSARQQWSAILHLPRCSVSASYTLSRVSDLCNPKLIEPHSNSKIQSLLLV